MVNPQILNFIKLHQEFFDSQIQDIQRISNGYSNEVFCIHTLNKKYYLRLAKVNPLINRQDEKAVFDALNIHYYFYDHKGNYLREGYDAEQIESWDRSKLKCLIKRMDEIHALITLKIDKFNPLQYDKLFKKSQYFTTYSQIYYDLVEKYRNSSLTVCHNDLNHSNFLCAKQKLFILDFERVKLNSRYGDGANFAREKLSLKQINYICKKNDFDSKIFADFLIMTCIHALQGTLSVTESPEIVHYRIEILTRLKLFGVNFK